jgi:hypothetical protein
VYPSRDAADGVARLLAAVEGVDTRVADATDFLAAERAEMRQELEDAVVAPQAALVASKEMVGVSSITIPVGMVIGALLALPFAAMSFGTIPVGGRIAIVAIIGAAGGATVGGIVGAGLGMRGPAEPSEAERGVTLRVKPDRHDVREALLSSSPLRLDVIDEIGEPVETLCSAGRNEAGHPLRRLRGRLAQPPGGDWSTVRLDGGERGHNPDQAVPDQGAAASDHGDGPCR